MASWQDFVDSAPEFASRVEALFTARKHHTMATLRKDGSPRISGTEVDFNEGQLYLGMMAGRPRGGSAPRSSCRGPQPRRRSSGGRPRRLEWGGKALRTRGRARRRSTAGIRSVPNRRCRRRADARRHPSQSPRHREVEPRCRTRSPRAPLTRVGARWTIPLAGALLLRESSGRGAAEAALGVDDLASDRRGFGGSGASRARQQRACGASASGVRLGAGRT